LTKRRSKHWSEDPDTASLVFRYFNEIGIINQLSSAMLARALPDDVHPSHFAIINHLYRMGDGRTPHRIAEAMQITRATMTHSIRVLENRGLITVKPNPEDARGKLVYLTRHGRAFRDSAVQGVTAMFANVLDDTQIGVMSDGLVGLEQIRSHLDSHR